MGKPKPKAGGTSRRRGSPGDARRRVTAAILDAYRYHPTVAMHEFGIGIMAVWRLVVPTPRVKNAEGFQPHEYMHNLTVGQAVLIEVRAPGGSFRPSPTAWSTAMAAGAIDIVAESVEDVARVIGPPIRVTPTNDLLRAR